MCTYTYLATNLKQWKHNKNYLNKHYSMNSKHDWFLQYCITFFQLYRLHSVKIPGENTTQHNLTEHLGIQGIKKEYR